MSGTGAAVPAHAPPLPGRDAIVATAHESIARGSKSFAAASLLFDRETRARAWLLYAWCRRCDDLIDGQDHGHGMAPVADAPARLAEVTAMTEAALAGVVVGDPAFDALRLVAAETAMPAHWPRDLIAGFALDVEGWHPRTAEDLYRYCYGVAGVVGCMMAVVMGVRPDDDAVLDRACDLGMAFQLANIARDLGEDDAAGRCYLPADWLAAIGAPQHGYMAPAHRAGIVALAQRLTDRAAAFEASARVGAGALSYRSAWAVLAAANIYGAIGRTVAQRGAAAWDRRVSTSTFAKLGFIVHAAAEAGRSPGGPARDPALWTRPHHRHGSPTIAEP